MSEELLQDRQRHALEQLRELAGERARSEAEHERGHRERVAAAKQEFHATLDQIRTRYEAEKDEAVREYQTARERIIATFERENSTTDRDYRRVKHDLGVAFDENREKAETAYQEARWAVTAQLEARKKDVETKLQRTEYRLKQTREELQTMERDSVAVIEMWGTLRGIMNLRLPPQKPTPQKTPALKLKQHLATAHECLDQMRSLRLPRWFRGKWLPALFLLIWLVGGAPLLLLNQWYYVVPGWSLTVLAAYFIGRSLLYHRARAQALQLYRPFRLALVQAGFTIEQLQRLAAARARRDLASATRHCHRALRHADRHYDQLALRLKDRHDADQAAADAKFQPLLAKYQHRQVRDLKTAEDRYQTRIQQVESVFESSSVEAENDHHTQMQGIERRREEEWLHLSTRWQTGMSAIQHDLQEVEEQALRWFPPWTASAWPADQSVPGSTEPIPRGMRFGELTVNLADIPDGVPKSAQLKEMAPSHYLLPALLTFPARAGVLYKAEGDGRAAAVFNLQSIMMRYLTALPPGKVRFTIIDPVGLGENFAAFMHLADHDEDLVTSRIWTESQQIEQRLTDLTDHMGDVIQKYLRNQYASIEDYNEQAGEVAEPYRVLVVANFPVNFSIDAARRLISIASTGSNCGVYTLISVDTTQPLPEGFNLADLEQVSLNLEWKDHHFEWQDADFGQYPLALDLPPENELATQLLHKVGAQAKEAKRVEVRFEFVAPRPEDWWHQNSTTGIRVPLGRAGATRRQLLELGQGTSQHVLIAGKTGSGKSSLLHALITNLALIYSPDEVELYLIDFKKGVEFKAYAVHQLAHARVVAIESEREFGLSVLQRLDAELKSRGEAFRKLGVNDVNAYRHANGSTSCPRILLIVDEFQEFFVEDDKLAQEAALLLDRLVRQGRAFGLHVLLGSQTLGGAYTLARSTIDQMAVRIALQCSEADAHLILSKDNSAARLLSRPGEAIYNDANGMIEGNDLFQIVWLPDDRREVYLRRLHDLAVARKPANGRSQIVFEGNAPADPQKNVLLGNLLHAPGWQPAPRAVTAWLGEAIAIKDPTSATFRPQTASNLLILGQHEEAAAGALSAALVSLASQHAPSADAATFYVLDGTPVDSPHAGVLAKVTACLPQRIQLTGWRDLPTVLNELAAEVSRREQQRATEEPHRFLIIQGLQWFRELRKQEDDFGYGRRGDEKTASPVKQLAGILRDGPAVGIHSLVWCDSLTNLQRALDRQGIREFEMRVLFQMSPADSSNLIDSPIASRLGLHRALFVSEEKSAPEKFRPYGLPAAEWLEEVQKSFEAKAQRAAGLVPAE